MNKIAGISYWTEQELEALKDTSKTARQLAVLTHRSEKAVEMKRRKLGIRVGLRHQGTNTATTVIAAKPEIELPKPEFGYLPLSVINQSGWITLGLVGDTHLACKEERLAELHTQYDLFVAEGITQVLHAGNLVDGYVPRINGGSVYETSIDGQCQYVINNYPARKGLTTYFITGDDHEGWWMKEGFNFGAYLTYLAKDQGREDLHYIGHVEADVELRTKGARAPTMLKIQHPGGGSAYARSYAAQKTVESFEGGEKPSILVQGHYHVGCYVDDRNVHVVGLPGFKDQDIFSRKKRLRMEVGGVILSFKANQDDGSVTRCRVEFNRYFTRGFYKHYLKSDRQVLKGHLVLKP